MEKPYASGKYPHPLNLPSTKPDGSRWSESDKAELTHRHEMAVQEAEKNYVKPPKGGKGPTKQDIYNQVRDYYQKKYGDAL